MVIRKPYLFLIKNFRLIHFFLLVISIYVLYKVGIIYSFFNDYVSTRQVVMGITSSMYIPRLLYFMLILLLLFSGAIFILLKQKDKPIAFYLMNIIYTIALFAICIISSRLILEMSADGIDPTLSRLIRDIWLMAELFQIFFLVFFFIRAIGFDFNKFKFGEDLAQIQITDEDNEEVEINAVFNIEKARMNAAMQREELKLFFYQYKVIIIVILVIVFAILPATFISKKIISERKWNENQIVKIDSLELKVLNTYITKNDYLGNTVYNGDNSFVIVEFEALNKSNEASLILENMRLEVGNMVYLSDSTNSDSFVDIGKSYSTQKINNQVNKYIVSFIVTDDILENQMIFRYSNSLGIKNGEIVGNYYRIILNPKKIDNSKLQHNVELGNSMNFSDSYLKNTSLNILKYDIKEDVTYQYNNSTKCVVNSQGLILELDYNLTLDSSLTINNILELLSKYGKLKYVYNNRTYTTNIEELSAPSYGENKFLIPVSENVKDASSIELLFELRNNTYTYKIK